jgi:hypothetical protein
LLRQAERHVVASLDDDFHEMTCHLSHDDRIVTDVTAETLRIPTSACPGAAAVLRELIGVPLDIDMAVLYGDGRPRRHCTLLFDLAALAIAHAGRSLEQIDKAIILSGNVRDYSLGIPDE